MFQFSFFLFSFNLIFPPPGFLEKNNDLLYRNLKEVSTQKRDLGAEDLFTLCSKQKLHFFFSSERVLRDVLLPGGVGGLLHRATFISSCFRCCATPRTAS